MQKPISIFLLLLLGCCLLPWNLLCMAHPFGHDHQLHEGPSPCELRKEYRGVEPALWPPMHCRTIFSQIDECLPTIADKIKIPGCDWIGYYIPRMGMMTPATEYEILCPHDIKSNSDPPALGSISLRGPPLLFYLS